jgi:succinylglutamate desuccinylase
MTPTFAPMAVPPAEVVPRDISGFRHGNAGIDYVHRFDSGVPGPAVGIAGLTHGNEVCGMTAVTWLLESGLRPARGSLTLWLGNVEAYERMRADDPVNQTRHRFVDRDMNRIWDDEALAAEAHSSEARRARALLPVVDSLDALLDIHSTTFCETPFQVYRGLAKNRGVADSLGVPPVHVLLKGGQHSGATLCERGRFGDPGSGAVALGVECGTHLSAAAGEVAKDVALRFLVRFGLLPGAFLAADKVVAPPPPQRRYLVERVFRPASDEARFARAFAPFEELSAGEPIVIDGDEVFVAPFDRCTVLMPSPIVTRGRDMVTLAVPMA